MVKKKSGGYRITFNAPVVLGFALICTAALLIDIQTGGKSNMLLFSVYRSSMTDPLTYLRFFGHVIGHANWNHLINNMMLLLVIGPMLEEKYGSGTLLKVMAITAFVTGLVNFILFPNIMLMGASGIVFAFILLASFTGFRQKEIPLTFIVVAILYLGEQIYDGFFVSDNISQLTHILGGVVGAFAGFLANRRS